MEWKTDGKYTIIGVGQMLAMTFRSEITVKGVDSKTGEPFWVERGKRKQKIFAQPVGRDMLVLEGWDLPLRIDQDQNKADGYIICGNACLNFLGRPEFVRDFIDKHNLNEYFARQDVILAHGDKVIANGAEESGVPVYPEAPTTHAVVKRMREKFGLAGQAPEVIVNYSREEAMDDGILTKNPTRDRFSECDVVTVNMFEHFHQLARQSGSGPETEKYAVEKLGSIMDIAKRMYDSKQFKGDNDQDFFVVKEMSIGKDVWFVRNEAAKLTAMFSEDY
jgi:hypothetical protein